MTSFYPRQGEKRVAGKGRPAASFIGKYHGIPLGGSFGGVKEEGKNDFNDYYDRFKEKYAL